MSGCFPEQGPGRRRRVFGKLVLVLDVAIAGYLGSYAAARAGHAGASQARRW